MTIAAPRDEFFEMLAKNLGADDLLEDPRFAGQLARIQNKDALNARLCELTKLHSKAALTEMLGGLLPYGPVMTMAELPDDPHIKSREMIVEIEQPGSASPLSVAGVPVKMSETPGGVHARAPGKGEHGDEILKEASFSEAENNQASRCWRIWTDQRIGNDMTARPKRIRRCQLAVPASNEELVKKAVASAADHVFLDLEDAVAPAAKPGARKTAIDAFNDLDWGKKTRCYRINDLRTSWCYQDIIEVVSGARENIDTLMIPKAMDGRDIFFVSTLLDQLEADLGMTKSIGLEVLIEETEGLQNVEDICAASPRMEAVIFGLGDYGASQGVSSRYRLAAIAVIPAIYGIMGGFGSPWRQRPAGLMPSTGLMLILATLKDMSANANAR